MDGNTRDTVGLAAVAVGQAACGIVHDLSNLLQTVILRSELTVSTEPISDKCAASMEQINRDVQNGAELVKNILEHARHSIDQLPPINLGDFFTDCFASLAGTGLLAAKVVVEVSDPPVLAKADTLQMKDMLALLVEELSRGTDTALQLSAQLGPVGVTGDEDSTTSVWAGDESWVELAISCVGAGAAFNLDELKFSATGNGGSLNPGVINKLRILGIVRQHRGQVKVLNNGDVLTVRVFWPGR